MPVTSFPEYAQAITEQIDNLLRLGQARLENYQVDQRAITQGFIAGIIIFENDSELHFREYVNLNASESRMMYSYHYQDAVSSLIFRYDNAAHRPLLAQPEHKHTPTGVMLTAAPQFAQIIDEILNSL